MNLSAVDLNLLVAFEALYDTRSVTLAAQRLNRAQPSVSNALGRLRLLFDDELFVRTRQGMQATERAQALIPRVTAALAELRAVLSEERSFHPAQAEGRRFTLAASDYADIVLLPHLLPLLRGAAPGIDIRVSALARDKLYGQLDDGQIDLAIGGHLAPPKRIAREVLYREEFVCLASARHPALLRRRLDLDLYTELPHALFVPSDDGSTRGVIDASLARLGRRRRVAATFAHVVALPQAVVGTDLLASLATRVAQRLMPKGARMHALPGGLGDTSFEVEMVYSRRSLGDPGLRWLRAQVMLAAKALQE